MKILSFEEDEDKDIHARRNFEDMLIRTVKSLDVLVTNNKQTDHDAAFIRDAYLFASKKVEELRKHLDLQRTLWPELEVVDDPEKILLWERMG